MAGLVWCLVLPMGHERGGGDEFHPHHHPRQHLHQWLQEKKRPVPRGAPVFVWVSRAAPILAESGGPARCGFIAYLSNMECIAQRVGGSSVHIAYVRRTFRLILVLPEIFCGGPVEFELICFGRQ